MEGERVSREEKTARGVVQVSGVIGVGVIDVIAAGVVVGVSELVEDGDADDVVGVEISFEADFKGIDLESLKDLRVSERAV